MTDSDWRADAACRGDDVRLWFPSLSGNGTRAVPEVLEVCAGCPVRLDCLEFAMNDRHAFRAGIWGGLNAAERERLRDERAARPPVDLED